MSYRVAVILTDDQRRIRWVNEDFTHITGYTLPEVIGKKPSLLQGPETEKETVRRMRRSLEAKVPFKDSVTNYRKNGEKYECKLVIHPVFDEHQNLSNFVAFEVDGGEVPDDTHVSAMQLTEKYRTSSLRGDESIALFHKLEALFREEKPYLDSKINLRELADRLKTNTKYLSQVVNFHAKTNLQQFINRYRVEEAKRRMLSEDYENLTLYGIAMQCGFKNKSTFYKVFKQLTNTTPMNFIRQAAR